MASQLPPLNAIRVFSVVAQKLNFARAAEELGVTQSAVSKQIQSLEDFIGTKLFERKAQGVALTSEGRELREAVLPAMEGLTQSFERYARRPPRSSVVRMTTTASFASLVLLPALEDFERENPELVLEILAGDRLFDLQREEVDFAVRFGPGAWREGAGDPLGPQTLSPVASPSLLDRYEGDREKLLSHARRIQIFGKNEWAAAKDLPPNANENNQANLFLENFHVAACAARLGHGVAFLPTVLLADEIRQQSLVVIGETLPWTESFRLVTPNNTKRTTHTKTAINWIKKLAG